MDGTNLTELSGAGESPARTGGSPVPPQPEGGPDVSTMPLDLQTPVQEQTNIPGMGADKADKPPVDEKGLCLDGPTPEEFVAAGYAAKPAKVVEAGPSPLLKAVTAGKDLLGYALRVLIENRVHDGSPTRNAIENGLERARTAVAKEVQYVHLHNLVKDLESAVLLMANHSLTDTDALNKVKEGLAAAEGILSTLPKPV